MKHKITYCIHAEVFYQIIRIKHIALGLAHLAVTLQ